METYPQRVEINLLIFQLKETHGKSGVFKENTGKGEKVNLSVLHQNNLEGLLIIAQSLTVLGS